VKSEFAAKRALPLLLVASGAFNALLAARVVFLEYRLRPAPPPIVNVGKRLPELAGHDPEGNSLTIRFSDYRKSTVLLVLRPGCSWCAKNMSNWQKLIQEAGQRYRFIAVSPTEAGLGKYLREYNLTIPAVTSLPNDGVLEAVWIGGTPQTIVVGPDGVVMKAWSGAYGRPVKTEIERYFGVTLPIDVTSSP